MPRSDQPDFLLFAAFSLVVFVPLSFWDPLNMGDSLVECLRGIVRGSVQWRHVGGLVCTAPMIAVPAAGFGWWAQGVAVRRGFTLRRRPRTDQAADYDDEPPER